MRTAAVCLLVALLLTAVGGVAADCNFTQAQLQKDALGILRKDYPEREFSAGEDVDVILMGEAQFGLDNLYAKLCVPASLDRSERIEEIRRHFAAMIKLIEEQEAPPPWADVRKAILMQLVTDEYFRSLTGDDIFVSRPLIPGVLLAVVIDGQDGYRYVRKEDMERWGVTRDALFEEGLRNLERTTASAKLEGSADGDKFLALQESDGYDAARILVPWVRQEAAKLLGDPFLAGIPNRDFLIMWSTANSGGFQKGARANIRNDFKDQPYALSARVLRVWADGRIEVE